MLTKTWVTQERKSVDEIKGSEWQRKWKRSRYTESSWRSARTRLGRTSWVLQLIGNCWPLRTQNQRRGPARIEDWTKGEKLELVGLTPCFWGRSYRERWNLLVSICVFLFARVVEHFQNYLLAFFGHFETWLFSFLALLLIGIFYDLINRWRIMSESLFIVAERCEAHGRNQNEDYSKTIKNRSTIWPTEVTFLGIYPQTSKSCHGYLHMDICTSIFIAAFLTKIMKQ